MMHAGAPQCRLMVFIHNMSRNLYGHHKGRTPFKSQINLTHTYVCTKSNIISIISVFLPPSDQLVMSLYTVHSSQSAVDSDLCVTEVKAVCVCALTFR